MPPALPIPAPAEEEDYDSAADSDFNASLSPYSGDESEASDVANAVKGASGRKETQRDGDAHMESGDEGIIAQRKKKRRKKTKKKSNSKEAGPDEEVEDEDDVEDGGEGIRVRLRSGRGGEDSSKRGLSKTSAATIDVDSIWARMNVPKSTQNLIPSQPSDFGLSTVEANKKSNEAIIRPKSPPLLSPSHAETIVIPHSYVFAGETHTSTKTVPASSPEALAYLASKDKDQVKSTGSTLRRPLARKGLLDPNPTGSIKGRATTVRADLPPSIGGNGARALTANAKASQWGFNAKGEKAKKLNTVEKSKLDWEQEVERQGIREELEKAEKSGASYLGRMEFLGRVEGGLEEESRRIRLAGKT